ncbi:MAG: hypothetical protein ACRDTH_26705 [Pseudonocardiaceae bacterium]
MSDRGEDHGTPPPTFLPIIDSPAAAGQALGDLFLANADRGDDAANDELVAELVRRIRAQQNPCDSVRGQHPLNQPAATAQVPAPQFGNSSDSGWPPVEQFPRPIPAPGGRSDTTTPMVIDRWVHLPVTSVDPVSGPSPELATTLMLDRFPTRTSVREQLSGPEPLAPSSRWRCQPRWCCRKVQCRAVAVGALPRGWPPAPGTARRCPCCRHRGPGRGIVQALPSGRRFDPCS